MKSVTDEMNNGLSEDSPYDRLRWDHAACTSSAGASVYGMTLSKERAAAALRILVLKNLGSASFASGGAAGLGPGRTLENFPHGGSSHVMRTRSHSVSLHSCRWPGYGSGGCSMTKLSSVVACDCRKTTYCVRRKSLLS